MLIRMTSWSKESTLEKKVYLLNSTASYDDIIELNVKLSWRTIMAINEYELCLGDVQKARTQIFQNW